MISPTHQCPRCDYDLCGQIAAWQTECPLAGQCPECGLTFAWTDLFNVEPPPRWSYEHAKGSFPAHIWSLVRSVARVAFPRRLWSTLKLSFPIVPSRLVQLAVAGTLLVHVLLASLAAAAICAEWWFKYYSSVLWIQYSIFGGMNSDVTTTLTNNWLNIAFPYATVSRGLGASFDSPPGATEIVVAFAAFLPAAFLLIPTTMRHAKVKSRHLLRISAYWVITFPFLALTLPLLRRLELISYNLTLMNWNKTPSVRVQNPFEERLFEILRYRNPVIATAIVLAYAWWFWSSASSRYLCLPRAKLDTLVLVVLAGLASLATEYLTSGGNHSATIQLLHACLPTSFSRYY